MSRISREPRHARKYLAFGGTPRIRGEYLVFGGNLVIGVGCLVSRGNLVMRGNILRSAEPSEYAGNVLCSAGTSSCGEISCVRRKPQNTRGMSCVRREPHTISGERLLFSGNLVIRGVHMHPAENSPTGLNDPPRWSGREDLNLRPPAPKAGALSGLRYAPRSQQPEENRYRLLHGGTAVAEPHLLLRSQLGEGPVQARH